MSAESVSFKKLLEKTDDVYESVVVTSKRAKQILQDRLVKQMITENEEEMDENIFSEPKREIVDFSKEKKVTSIALDEFLNGKVDWTKSEETVE